MEALGDILDSEARRGAVRGFPEATTGCQSYRADRRHTVMPVAPVLCTVSAVGRGEGRHPRRRELTARARRTSLEHRSHRDVAAAHWLRTCRCGSRRTSRRSSCRPLQAAGAVERTASRTPTAAHW